MFIDKVTCTECGGECCKNLPGACLPSDFGLPGSFTKLDKAFESGRYCIDWWEGDPREGKTEYEHGYFVRPATKNRIGTKYDPSWGGECNFLTENNCELEPNDRPSVCQNLEPIREDDCIAHIDRQYAAIAWLPYYDKIKYKYGRY